MQKEGITKEINDLKSVIKCIEDYKLESEYPKDILLQRIEKLENERLNRKRATAAPASVPEQHSKPQKESVKRSRTTEQADLATIPTTDTASLSIPKSVASTSALQLYQPPLPQSEGLLPDHPDPFLTLPAGPYRMAGPNPAIVPYMDASAGLYESSGTSMSFYGNASTTGSNIYPSGSHMPSGYVDGQIAYGGYGFPPEYHPYYYP